MNDTKFGGPAPSAGGPLNLLYGHSLALLTDLYQLTMAYGYWKQGMADRHAAFNLFFRRHPFGGGFSVACGLRYLIDYLTRWRFDDGDLAYLATLQGNDGAALFEDAFLDHLAGLRFAVDVDAVPEGTVVFPHEPLVRVTGPILQGQILETPLLNMINFQTLIATKAARIAGSARGEPVLEFGLRRAQGIDGALSVSRAAYVGGCTHTSNVLAGKVFGIPVKGTHAHSWVMSFDDEQASFEAYADAMPNNCVFLVDTYDTIEGVRRAVTVGRSLRERGHEMIGIRLDSGDLAYLSVEARRLLDEAGFERAIIIASLKDQGAAICVWGVGTRLATAHDQPAMGGVYKLAAIRGDDGWQPRVKISEQTIKVSTPGLLGVRRYSLDGEAIADVIYDERFGVASPCVLVDPLDATRRRTIEAEATSEELLAPIFRDGALVYDLPTLSESRDRAASQLERFHAGIRRFVNPHTYPVGLEKRLHDLRTQLVLQARGVAE